ncbi:hypothetical protein F5Y10DRAFT_248799 [Nemania abortiva]|nr:hypothetical protein F5Y10DRAFT_248799 [Nemania abortiva]
MSQTSLRYVELHGDAKSIVMLAILSICLTHLEAAILDRILSLLIVPILLSIAIHVRATTWDRASGRLVVCPLWVIVVPVPKSVSRMEGFRVSRP